MPKLDLSKLIHYVENPKNENTTKLNLGMDLLSVLRKEDYALASLKRPLICAYMANWDIEKKAATLNRQDKKSWGLGKLWHHPSLDKRVVFSDIMMDASGPEYLSVESIPPFLPDKLWYQSQRLHTIIYDIYQQILEHEKNYKSSMESILGKKPSY
jgi:hypothetical protein